MTLHPHLSSMYQTADSTIEEERHQMCESYKMNTTGFFRLVNSAIQNRAATALRGRLCPPIAYPYSPAESSAERYGTVASPTLLVRAPGDRRLQAAAPIPTLLGQSMPHRAEVDALHVSVVVLPIPYGALPEPALPRHLLATALHGRAQSDVKSGGPVEPLCQLLLQHGLSYGVRAKHVSPLPGG
jgi:hypothetical protein